MRRFLTIVIFNFCFIGLSAQQVDFIPHTLYEPDLKKLTAIYTVDLDQDGYMDQILDSYGNETYWLKNDGNQNFTKEEIPSGCNDKRSIAILDFDMDGDIDLVKACGSSIKFIENDGSQNFTVSTLITAGGDLNLMYVRDLDSDGDYDIITNNIDDDLLYWFENDGSNTLTQHTFNTAFPANHYFEIVDLDEDGYLDIVITDGWNDIILTWLKNDGSQNFGYNELTSTFTSYTSSSPIIKIVDLDGDGDLDILAGSKSNGPSLYYYVNDGNENFAKLTLGVFGNILQIDAVDIDNDGDLDIVQTNQNFSFILVNDGNENFTLELLGDNIPEPASSLSIADIDSDGDLDINLFFGQEGDVFWYENDGSLPFEKHVIHDPIFYGLVGLSSVDLDSDSDVDILTFDSQAKNLVWFENDGNEDFTYSYISDTIGDIRGISTVDLDSDGDIDVLSASVSPSKMLWFENDGSQNFTQHNIDNGTSYSAYTIESADVNNDGFMDVVSGDFNKLRVYTNDGNENFTEYVELDSNIFFKDVVLYDIDSDGDIDIFTATGLKYAIIWFENDGTGNFTQQEITASYWADGSNEISIADVDNDADYDIIVAGWNSYTRWFKNDGNENFTEDPSQFSSSNAVHVNDINDDGYLDILLRDGWHEADSLQNFTINVIPDNYHRTDVFSVDLDDDGDFDILSTSKRYQQLTWHENLLYNNYIKISVVPFVDVNGNGIFDSTEYFYQNEVLEMSPQALFTMSTQDTTTFLLNETGLYTIDLHLDTALWLATSPTSIQVDVISENFYDTVFFGVQPKLDYAINSDVTGMWPRCLTEVQHTLNLTNYGLAIDTGYMEYTLDNAATFVSSIPSPDSINGQTLYYNFSNLPSSYSKTVYVNVDLPGTIMNLYHDYKVYADTGQFALVDSINFTEEVRCSYDPNDKQVFPNYGDSGYVLNQSTELEYLIRFQNTGNDTAFVVELKDSLALNLDESTFRLISQSHPLTSIEIDSNRVLTFLFNNINLTDTITNEAESHGFVKFGIRAKENLPLNTSITNEASIYFDHNPPIVTNSTLNTIYDCNVLGNSITITAEYPEITVDINEYYLENAFWMWNGDVIHSGMDGFTFIPDTVGNIDLMVYLENDLCTFDTTYSIYINNIGIVENKAETQLSVFPNPTTGVFYLDLGEETEVFTTRLSTMTGQFLMQETYNSTRMVSLELPEEKGIYLLEVLTKGGTSEFVKIIKQ